MLNLLTTEDVVGLVWDSNGLRLLTVDRNGTIHVYLDRNDPKYDFGLWITIEEPLEDGDYFKDIHLAGTATDNVQVVFTRYSLNSGPWVNLTNPNEWNISIHPSDLREGRNTIVVNAWNGTGERNATVSFGYTEPGSHKPYDEIYVLLVAAVALIIVLIIVSRRRI